MKRKKTIGWKDDSGALDDKILPVWGNSDVLRKENVAPVIE